MVLAASDRPALRRAFLASLGIHLLVALLITPLIFEEIAGPKAIETFSFSHLFRTQLERHRVTKTPPVAIPQTLRHATTITFARHRTELSAKTKSPKVAPTAVNAPEGEIAAAPRVIANAVPQPRVAVPPKTLTDVPHPQGTQQVEQTGGTDRGGTLPFLAEQPPALDATIRAKLQQLGVHVTITVAVSDDGHTKSISYDRPLDAQMQKAIEAILNSASWDPAVCGGGVTCDGKAIITL